MVQGCPVCLRALAAAKESRKFTFAQPTTVYSSNPLADLFSHKATQTLLPFSLQQLHLLFIESPHITLGKFLPLNPASLLPVTTETITHSCLEILDSKLCPFSNTTKQRIPTASLTRYIHGSSFLPHGTRRAGYIITSRTHTTEANPLLLGTTSQKAELIALI